MVELSGGASDDYVILLCFEQAHSMFLMLHAFVLFDRGFHLKLVLIFVKLLKTCLALLIGEEPGGKNLFFFWQGCAQFFLSAFIDSGFP